MEFKNKTFKFFGEAWSIKFVDQAPITERQGELGNSGLGTFIYRRVGLWITTKD